MQNISLWKQVKDLRIHLPHVSSSLTLMNLLRFFPAFFSKSSRTPFSPFLSLFTVKKIKKINLFVFLLMFGALQCSSQKKLHFPCCFSMQQSPPDFAGLLLCYGSCTVIDSSAPLAAMARWTRTTASGPRLYRTSRPVASLGFSGN